MQFSGSACIRFGWETFKKRPWFFIGAFLLYLVASWAINFVSGFIVGVDSNHVTGNVVSAVVSFLLDSILGIALIMFTLRIVDSPETVTINDAWPPRNYWHYVLVSFLTMLIVGIGIVLLIVPGIIFSLMFMFGGYLVVDRGLTAVDGLKESARITKGHKWQLLGLVLLGALLNVLGAIALIIGLLVTVPVTMLAFAHAYRILSANAGTSAVV